MSLSFFGCVRSRMCIFSIFGLSSGTRSASPPRIATPLSITGLGALSALGKTLAEHHSSVATYQTPGGKLGSLLGESHSLAQFPAAWIEQRSLLTHRKWSPASMAALHVARQAVTEAGWSAEELRDAALVVGTSRGSAAGWLSPWPGRRGFKLMAASNAMHGEPAAAISIELQIQGPYQVTATGCSAGLDALGMASLMVQAGVAPRALAVAVDLPLVAPLLENYAATGILTRTAHRDPYGPQADGFLPAEGAAAICLEAESRQLHDPWLLDYLANSDAMDPVGTPLDGGRMVDLLKTAVDRHGNPVAICPHATGTKNHAIAEPAGLRRALASASHPTLHLLKTVLGHTVGASGLLESVVLCSFLRKHSLPPNLPARTAPDGFVLPDISLPCTGPVFKLASSLGGHNALAVFAPAP